MLNKTKNSDYGEIMDSLKDKNVTMKKFSFDEFPLILLLYLLENSSASIILRENKDIISTLDKLIDKLYSIISGNEKCNNIADIEYLAVSYYR